MDNILNTVERWKTRYTRKAQENRIECFKGMENDENKGWKKVIK